MNRKLHVLTIIFVLFCVDIIISTLCIMIIYMQTYLLLIMCSPPCLWWRRKYDVLCNI